MFSKLLLSAVCLAHADALGLQGTTHARMLLDASNWDESERFGGTYDKEFDDTNELLYGIKRIEVLADDWVQSLMVTYNNGEKRTHGKGPYWIEDGAKDGSDLDQPPFAIGEQEKLSEIKIVYAGGKQGFICSLQFKTSEGRSITYGGDGGRRGSCDQTHISGSNDREIKSFIGRAADQLTALGWYSGNDCDVVSGTNTGYWDMIIYSNNDFEYELSVGREKTYSEGNTQTWSEEATKSTAAGFTFTSTGGVGVSGERSVGSSYSESIASSMSASVSTTETSTMRIKSTAGALWQWKMDVTDLCGTSTILDQAYVTTNSVMEVPCCPPGFAKDVQAQHGECVDPSLSICQ